MKRNEKKGPTNFWNHPKIFIAIFTIIPIFLFAVNDMEYWEVIQRNFGLNNSWYAIAINFQTDHGGSTYGYLFPNCFYSICYNGYMSECYILFLLKERTVKLVV